MPSFSPSFSNRLLVAIGTGAMLVLIVVLVSGGFVIDAGPLHLSARRAGGPLVIALAAFAAAFLFGRAHLAQSAGAVRTFLDTHAASLAILLAAAVAGIGVGYGTYSATGADASGYISQAELLTSARLVQAEPLARQAEWPLGTWTFTPLGYRPGPVPGDLVPTYASGLPLTMAAAWLATGEIGLYLVVPLLGALAVLCTYGLGARLHSRGAGVIAAALLATSPIVLFQIVQPMSDVPVTAWWALSLWLALRPSRGGAVGAGLAAGIALLTRPNLMPMLLPVVTAVVAPWSPGTPKQRLHRTAFMAAGVVPAMAAVLLLQWRLYGNPLFSGYGTFSELFALSTIAPNIRGYAARMFTGEGPALTLGVASLVALAIARRSPGTQPPSSPATKVRLLLWLGCCAAVSICYLPYAVFSEWHYLRFLLPAFPLTFVVIGALLVDALTLLPQPARGIVLAAAITAACSFNINHASREQAFNLRRYDARYRLTGRYLDAVLPDEAVVLSVQQSGSIRYYAHVPIVRWDLIGADLDGTLATLTALGRHPFVLIEDWEKPDFAARFKTSPVARFDWTARADIGNETRALLYDLADRQGRVAVVTDRFDGPGGP